MNARVPRTVVAFAYLADQYARTGDLAAGIVPLFAPIAAEQEGRPFEPTEFAQEVQETYGIRMHPYAAEGLAPLLARAGLLVEESHLPTALSYRYARCALPEVPYTEGDVKRVCMEFHAFAAAHLSAIGIATSESQSSEALIDRLVQPEFLGIILRPDRVELPSRTLSLTRAQDDADPGPANSEGHFDYLVARFLADRVTKDTKEAEFLVGICTGALVSEVILDLQHPPQGGEHLPGLRVVIDTSLICDALDVGLEQAKSFATLLIEQIRQAGAVPVIFDFTLEEIRGVLLTPLHNYEQRRTVFGPLGRRLRRDATFPAYLRSAIAGLRENIEALGVEILSYDAADRLRARAFFTETLEQELSLRIGHYETDAARDHDALAIADILRRRGPDRSTNLRHAQFVFITRNGRLASLSRKFLNDKALAARDYFPPCITDRFLAGLLWIAMGGGDNRLSRLQLIAHCSAALVPRRDIATRMHRFLADLNPARVEAFDALMTNERIENFLMDRTMGDARVITERNFEAIYAELEEQAAEKVTAKKDAEIERLRNEHTAAVDALAEERRAERMRTASETLKLEGQLGESKNELTEAQARATQLLREREERDRLLVEADRRWMSSIIRVGKNAQRRCWAFVEVALLGVAAITGLTAPISMGNRVCVAVLVFLATTLAATVGNRYWPDNFLDRWLGDRRDKAAWKFADKHAALDILGRYEIDWDRGDFHRKK
jgi:hypothetical protein